MEKQYTVITKESILAHKSQEQIFEYYFGEPIEFGRLYRSPLRNDDYPTGGFAYSKSGKLYFRDFSGHFWDDAFAFVMQQFNLGFYDALEKIAADLDILELNLPAERKQELKNKPIIKKQTIIQIASRAWSRNDIRYWNSFGVGLRLLKFFRVSPLKAAWVNGELRYSFSVNDPVYAYNFGNDRFKLYFPNRSTFRFICNTNVIQGWDQLPESGNLCVITKSFKDVIVLRAFGIASVAWQGEAIIPDQDVLNGLKKRFKMVVSLYDYDLTGIRTANVLKRRDGITPYFLTPGCGAKDPAEYVERYGIEKAKILRDQFINHIKEKLYESKHFGAGAPDPYRSLAEQESEILRERGSDTEEISKVQVQQQRTADR